MATEEQPGFVGRRLREVRTARSLTAEQLAQRVAGGAVSRTVITNVESGRKRDLTTTELLLVSDALGISPLQLIGDEQDIWGKVPFSSLSGRFGEMTNIDFFRRASFYDEPLASGSGTLPISREVRLYEALIGCEVSLRQLEFLSGLDESNNDLEFSVVEKTDFGHDVWISGPKTEEGLWELEQGLVDRYRNMLRALEWVEEFGSTPSARIRERVEKVRQAVVTLIEQRPDLDYGQNDRFVSKFTPPLDPRTGQPDRSTGRE